MRLDAFKRHSIKTSLTLTTLIVVVLSVWLLAFYASHTLRQDMERQLGEQQFGSVSLLAAQVNQELSDRMAMLEKVASEVSPATLSNREALQRQLESYPQLTLLFNNGAFVVDAHSTAIADVPVSARRVGVNGVDRDYLVAALQEGKSSIGRPVLGKLLGTPVFAIAAPIRDAKGLVIGALVGVISLDAPNFLDKIVSSPYGKTGGYFLASAKHRLNITATDKSRVMKDFPAPGVIPALDRFAQGFEGTQVYVNPLGIETLVSAKGVPVAGWILAANLHTAEAFAPIRSMLRHLELATLAASLPLCALIWWLTAWLLHREIAPLQQASRLLATSTHTAARMQPLPVTSRNEVGEVIENFNQLMVVFAEREEALRSGEERWNFALEGTGAGVWDWNIQTGAAVLSRRWKEMLGYGESEIGNNASEWSSRVHPDDMPATMRAIEEHMAGQTPVVVVEFRMQRKDGRYIWMLGRGLVVSRSADGRALRLVGTQEDITERKLLEQKLRTSEEKHRVLLDESSDPIFSFDAQGNYSYVNKAFGQAFGKSADELIGLNPRELFPPDDAEKKLALVQWIFKHGQTRTVDVMLPRPGGDRHLITTAKPILNEQNEVTSVICISKDVTELKLAEQAAHAADRAKSDFLANMSHEIRTPMNGVVGMVDILQETALLPEQQRMLRTIHQSSIALLQILNDILDFSKIEAGKLEVESVPLHLCEVAEGAAQLMSSMPGNQVAEVSLAVSTDLPDWVYGDPTRLRQVLLNLLGNALKFTDDKGNHRSEVSLCVAPCVLADGHSGMRFEVTDNGIGMSPELVAKLFSPFTQADQSVARKFGGTGLGLSISQRLARLMGGSISVRSTLGIGSVFTLELPLQEAPAERPVPELPSLAGVRVLIATSNPFGIDARTAYCKAAGAQTRVVPDLAAAREFLSHVPGTEPWVVLVDKVVAAPTSSLGLPPHARVVREQSRNTRLYPDDIILPVRPMLRHDLIHVIAQASGHSVAAATHLPVERRVRVRTQAPTVEQAAHDGELILLAEDNETNRDVMQEQLRLLGYACEMAHDGAQALQMWQAGRALSPSQPRYAVLLTDCHMPAMDGFALTAAIRAAEPAGSRIPIIAITANAMQGEAQRCRERGMDDYLSKPLRMSELSAILDKWLPVVATPELQGESATASAAISEQIGL